MKRKIVHIREELCNGCGLCVNACHEGAIELVGGVAKLVSDIYCDGLGACLPECPTGAIEIIEREAEAFDEEAVARRIAGRERMLVGGCPPHPASSHAHGHVHNHQHEHGHGLGGCPGSMARRIERAPEPAIANAAAEAAIKEERQRLPSELTQWPVQIALVNPGAPFLEDANLLVAADCTAYAYADFHRDFIRNRITLIGCPKLDDNRYYMEKLTEIFQRNRIKSVTVVRMVVPCCNGIAQAVKQAMLNAQTIMPYREVVVGIDGNLADHG